MATNPDKKVIQKYVALLCNAIQLFYMNDAEALFESKQRKTCERIKEKKNLNERTMVGCIYRYVWCLRHDRRYAELEQDVDIEYDRKTSDIGEFIEKGLIKCDEKDHCFCFDKCWQTIFQTWKGNSPDRSASDENRKGFHVGFRPDLIVHKRNSKLGQGNGLVAEFKKERGSHDKDLLFDIAKVRFCTCEKQEFRYLIGGLSNS